MGLTATTLGVAVVVPRRAARAIRACEDDTLIILARAGAKTEGERLRSRRRMTRSGDKEQAVRAADLKLAQQLFGRFLPILPCELFCFFSISRSHAPIPLVRITCARYPIFSSFSRVASRASTVTKRGSLVAALHRDPAKPGPRYINQPRRSMSWFPSMYRISRVGGLCVGYTVEVSSH